MLSLVQFLFLNDGFQVQLQSHCIYGPAWILQLPQLVRRACLVPSRAYRRWHRVPGSHDHFRRHSLCPAHSQYPCPHQRHLCLPRTYFQVSKEHHNYYFKEWECMPVFGLKMDDYHVSTLLKTNLKIPDLSSFVWYLNISSTLILGVHRPAF